MYDKSCVSVQSSFFVLVGLLHSLASGTSYLSSVTKYSPLIGQAPGTAGLWLAKFVKPLPPSDLSPDHDVRALSWSHLQSSRNGWTQCLVSQSEQEVKTPDVCFSVYVNSWSSWISDQVRLLFNFLQSMNCLGQEIWVSPIAQCVSHDTRGPLKAPLEMSGSRAPSDIWDKIWSRHKV